LEEHFDRGNRASLRLLAGDVQMNLEACYSNIPLSARNRPVYRIISLARLFEMFERRVNTLVNPIMWDDPFENFVQGFKGQLPSGDIVEFAQRHEFYGQCWTLVGASDAMWRIYSSDKQSVRIKIRLKTLVDTLAPRAHGIVLVGKVRYLYTEGLLKWARRVFRDSDAPDIRLLGQTLLVKRMAFSHEQEIRILYFDSRAEGRRNLFSYYVDPHAFIEEIVVDPRLSTDQATSLMDEIRAKTGFRGPMSHSNLYAPPEEMTLRLGAAYSTFKRAGYRKVVSTEPILRASDAIPVDSIWLPVRDLRFT
jgi:hypothetical protein